MKVLETLDTEHLAQDEAVMTALERYFLIHALTRPVPAPRWAEW